MFKYLKSRSNFKVNVRRLKKMVPVERSFHKEHTYEIPITYMYYHSKDIANITVFEK
jgi:hypothetical protein